MSVQNIRRANTESYDPKQRFVGGVMLVLIMLFIYSTLKIVLGFSSTPNFEIGEALQSESTVVEGSDEATLYNVTNVQSPQTPKVYHRLPTGFVFLSLSGKTMQPDNVAELDDESIPANDLYTKTYNDGKWYVQAASFRSKSDAQNLAEQIQTKNIASKAYIVLRNGWYAVRLSPQDERGLAKQQDRQLRRKLHLKPMIKKIQ